MRTRLESWQGARGKYKSVCDACERRRSSLVGPVGDDREMGIIDGVRQVGGDGLGKLGKWATTTGNVVLQWLGMWAVTC